MATAETTKRGRATPRRLSDAEIDAQIPAAKRREAAAYASGLRATAARYDKATERVVLELSNGVGFAFPVTTVRGLEHASHMQRAALELDPAGSGVIWNALDADISVPGLLAATFRRAGVASLLGTAGGAAKSEAKASAARANGAKGGRPRRVVVERKEKGAHAVNRKGSSAHEAAKSAK